MIADGLKFQIVKKYLNKQVLKETLRSFLVAWKRRLPDSDDRKEKDDLVPGLFDKGNRFGYSGSIKEAKIKTFNWSMSFKRMERISLKYNLYGWDDGKLYFWDEKRSKEWCVSDEKELYNKLLKMCIEYFENKRED